MEKDAVFIPAGWDNDKKIAILYENMHRYCLTFTEYVWKNLFMQNSQNTLNFSVRPDQYYTDVIARPMITRRAGSGQGGGGGQVREVEVVAEEEQQFLGRQQQYLAQGLPPSQGIVLSIVTSEL